MASTFRNLTAFMLVVSGLAVAQNPVPAVFDFNKILRPPMPADTMELVTGAAQPVQDAQQRIAAIGLLNKAHDLSNVRAQPYDLKTSFIAYGGLASDGNWSLQDTSRGRKYRWTANGPNYSAVNLYPDGSTNALYSNQVTGTLPLRLLQVRSAIFFIYPTPGPQASVRTCHGFSEWRATKLRPDRDRRPGAAPSQGEPKLGRVRILRGFKDGTFESIFTG